ncbi:MAG TPA: hypothetical protein VL096_22265 [Pirellulaceae bacterium]|nr:hypothetical protein [Pirellulaceae bacterium]
METPPTETKQQELARLQARVAELERELTGEPPATGEWMRSGYYLTYYATTGFFLGMLAALVSLMFNIVGSSLAGKDPLELIKVYLTFGLGEKARDPNFDDGLALAVGCCLYIATGMLLGILFQVVLTRYAAKGGLAQRLLWASGLAIVIWLVNFYLLLSWLQPLLFGGNWIVDNEVLPWWVAMATHLVFGWTMAIIYPLGLYQPYRLQTEQS